LYPVFPNKSINSDTVMPANISGGSIFFPEKLCLLLLNLIYIVNDYICNLNSPQY
jgi:hypothetical protein